MSVRFRPLYDSVLVERIEALTKTESGLFIPDSGKEKPQEGKVVAVGNGRMTDAGLRIPLDVQENDTIIFGKYCGFEIELDGKKYLTLREPEILGIVG